MREFVRRQWLYLRSRWATPTWLDALPDEHKKIVATGPFPRRLRRLAATHVGTFSWVMVPHEGTPEIHNGSMFLLDCVQGLFLVTAGHVYTGYLAQRDAARRIICQIGDLGFYPEERLIDLQEQPDIARRGSAPKRIPMKTGSKSPLPLRLTFDPMGESFIRSYRPGDSLAMCSTRCYK